MRLRGALAAVVAAVWLVGCSGGPPVEPLASAATRPAATVSPGATPAGEPSPSPAAVASSPVLGSEPPATGAPAESASPSPDASPTPSPSPTPLEGWPARLRMTGKGTIAFPGSVAFGFSFSTSLVKTATPKDMYGVAYVPVAKSTVTMWVTQGVPPRCRVTPVKRAVPIDRSKGNLGSPTSLILLGRRESGSSLLVSGSMQAKPDPDLVIGRDCHDRYSPTNASFFQTMVSGGTFGGAWGIDGAVVPLVAGEPFPTVRGKTSSRFAEGWPLLTATWTISPSR